MPLPSLLGGVILEKLRVDWFGSFSVIRAVYREALGLRQLSGERRCESGRDGERCVYLKGGLDGRLTNGSQVR